MDALPAQSVTRRMGRSYTDSRLFSPKFYKSQRLGLGASIQASLALVAQVTAHSHERLITQAGWPPVVDRRGHAQLNDAFNTFPA